jgi:hypothetical protein
MNKLVKRILVTSVVVLLLVVAWYVSPDQRHERRCKLNARLFENALKDGRYEQALQEYMQLDGYGIGYAHRIRSFKYKFPYAPMITGKENTACAYIETPIEAKEHFGRVCFGMFSPNGIDNWYIEAITPDGTIERIADNRKKGRFLSYQSYRVPSDEESARKYSKSGNTSVYGKTGGLDIWGSSAGHCLTTLGKYKLVLHVFESDGEEITTEAEMVIARKP